MSDSLQPHELQHARLPCPSPTPGVHPNPRPSSRWCHPAISSSVVPFSSCPQSLPASESFPMSQLFSNLSKIYSFAKMVSVWITHCTVLSQSWWVKKRSLAHIQVRSINSAVTSRMSYFRALIDTIYSIELNGWTSTNSPGKGWFISFSQTRLSLLHHLHSSLAGSKYSHSHHMLYALQKLNFWARGFFILVFSKLKKKAIIHQF